MAEGLAQKWFNDNGFGDWLAVSAGIFACEGSPTSEETIEALLQQGIAFEGTSTQLTKKMATSVKAIFCMSQSHLVAVQQFTDHAELLNPEGNILDPIGQDQSVYDVLAEQMEALITTKLQALTAKENT